MNKKQLIVTWVTVFLISSLCMHLFFAIGASDNSVLAKYGLARFSPAEELIRLTLLIIPLSLIGGLLVYTLRDKKE